MELLKVENLTFTYPRQAKDVETAAPALDHVSFSVQNGEFIVICGESGCGKTTLLRRLKRELAPHAGEITGQIWFLRCGAEACSLSGRPPVRSDMCSRIRRTRPSQTRCGMSWPLAWRTWECADARDPQEGGGDGLLFWDRRLVPEEADGQLLRRPEAAAEPGYALWPCSRELLILDEPTSQLDPIAASDFINTLVKINKELGLTIMHDRAPP